MQTQEHFYSKLLLFGEYSILFGSSALSIPYSQFQAELSFIRDDKYTALDKAEQSNSMMKDFLAWLGNDWPEAGDHLDLARFRYDLSEGLYLESTIPQGYGLGSSGALCAAVYHRYTLHKQGISIPSPAMISALRIIFAKMESFFHGQSSGIDPLAIYLKSPLHVKPDGNPEIVGIPRNWNDKPSGIFLIDTGYSGKTSSFVPDYLKLFVPDGKRSVTGEQLLNLNNHAIESLLRAEMPAFWETLSELSAFQFRHMQSVIPRSMDDCWQQGLDSGDYCLKICGSGGGGFLTGFAPDYNKARIRLKSSGIRTIPVFLAG
ncbi:MAG TPA: hypothetical protein P5531_13560 [Bacteroidales bacterium]|nr:hypothetical protein [Bacteroidales bacterium]HSA44636.1 hypothetical protein [Bacteroidales bacterium]